MPDHEDSQRGIVESTRRFYSLFSEWICSLTFKQLSGLGSRSSSVMNKEGEPIVLSSDDESLVDLTNDDNRDDSGSRRSLPNWMTHGGVHMHSTLQNCSKKPYSHDAHHYRGESGPSTSKKPYSHTRDADYGHYSNKRAHPPSFGSSRTHSKPNMSWENLSKNRGYLRNVNLDNNHSRILPPTLAFGKAGPSANYTSTSDPYQNIGPSEDSDMGDERVIFQAALQDLNQPKSELDVPPGALTVPLLRHQKIALAWMVEKESRTMHCLGGILADDQGLGKTISTIALILKQWPAQVKSKSENNSDHNAEALTLDDDDYDEGINRKDTSVGKQKLDEVSLSEHKTLIVDVDDDDDDAVDGSITREAVEKMENVDDGNISAETVENTDNVNGSKPKPKSKSSSTHETSNRRKPSAGTLIVCPATVLRQWHRELGEKVSENAKLNVLLYHGGNRIKDPAKLASYDVVLTTYSIVANEVPKQPTLDEEDVEMSSDFPFGKKRKNPHKKSKKGKKGKKVAESSLHSQAGALARVNWFRVVLDEAQTIKNHTTLTAKACCGLRAKRRWCLSGTPIQNSIDEMFSYFRFLRHQYYSSYKNFYDYIKNPISKDPNIGYKKLQAVLRTLLLRRTKDTLLDGEPIISLPPKSIEMKIVHFNVEERAFYNQLEAESRSQFKAYAAAGTVNQNYANILLMILRLRQACDHPFLVTGVNSDSLKRTNLDKARQLPRHILMDLLNHLESPSAICLLCSDPAEDAIVTICGHVFCYQCVGDYINGDDTQCPAPRCREELSEYVLFPKATLRSCLSADFDANTSNGDGSSNSSPVLSRDYLSSKIKAALAILFSNSQLNRQFMEGNDDDFMGVQVRTEVLDDVSSKTPIKTIIFSQWTRMLDLFEVSLNGNGIQFRRLDGGMSLAARDRAVREFNTDPQVTVMLMSLKAGNLGLNMVAACHVILLDLWWNPTTEDQAIDRAHRIGQTRPVTVSRITIKDTVEDRILALQEEKRKMVASAFGEEHVAGSQVKLTAEDLRFFLFGTRS